MTVVTSERVFGPRYDFLRGAWRERMEGEADRPRALTEKGRMLMEVPIVFPDRCYPRRVFKVEDEEKIAAWAGKIIEDGKSVGMVTCFEEGERVFGRSPWLMGMDNWEIWEWFFRGERGDYRYLVEEHPAFRMDEEALYKEWLRSAREGLVEIAVIENPAGHGVRREDHFVAGVGLVRERGRLVIIVEIGVGTYHTRVIERRGKDSLIRVRVEEGEVFDTGGFLVDGERLREMMRSEGYSEGFLKSLTGDNLAGLTKRTVKEVVELADGGSFRRAEMLGYEVVDFIGRWRGGWYFKAFEMKGSGV